MKIYNIRYKVAIPIYGGSSRNTGILETHIKAWTRKQALRKLHRRVKKEVFEWIYYAEELGYKISHNNTSN